MDQGQAGGLIRDCRLAAGLTQKQLADAAGVSIGVVRDVEQHRTEHLHAESVRRLTAALGLDRRRAVELANLARGKLPTAGAAVAAGWAGGLRLVVLGPLAAHRNGVEIALGPALQRAVLGLLALHSGAALHRATIVDALWDDHPPATAVAMIQSYVSRLRRLLGPARDPAGLLTPVGGGYRLCTGAGELDLADFAALIRRAEQDRAAGELAAACEAYAEALDVWRGEPLADVDVLRGHPAVARLSQQRADAVIGYAEVAAEMGWHERVLPRLRELTGREPLNERAHARLMIALAGSGHQAAALHVYEKIRHRLDDELGVRPSAELGHTYARVLRQDIAAAPGSAHATASPRSGHPGRTGAQPVVPRQLPGAAAHFAGRDAELNALTDLLDHADRTGGTVVISAIAGTAGVGKTALAIHWAHLVADRFPGGQLYVNLRGFDPSGQPMDAASAIRGFLDALAVPPSRIPADLHAQIGLYRSQLADRRVLVVLDNVRDAEQVRPLLPGSAGCLALVTSRNQLTGLVAVEGAHPLALDLLTGGEARELLARRLGAERVTGQERAVDELIDLCAGLPLALSIAAARAALRPDRPLDAMVGELRGARRRLDRFSTGDAIADVRAVLSWSYQTLSTETARMFRLLCLNPGPDITIPATASLTGVPHDHARHALTALTNAHLLTEHMPGRYTFHDLLRAYATEQAHEHDIDVDRNDAEHRVLDHYLHTAHSATLLLYPNWLPLDVPPPLPGVAPEDFADRQQAVAWYAAEHAVLLAAATQAAAHGFDAHAWQIPRALMTFLDQRGYWRDSAIASEVALAAAERSGDLAGQAHAHRWLGNVLSAQGCFPDAHLHMRQALALFAMLGDRAREGSTHIAIGRTFGRQNLFSEALNHSQRAWKLYRAIDDLGGQGRALNNVGWFSATLGRYEQALTYCRQALELSRRLGDSHNEAAVLDSIGYVHHLLGHHAQAITHYRCALQLRRTIGDYYYQAETLTHIGDTHHAIDEPDAARAAWNEALTILEDLDHPDADAVRAKLHDLISIDFD
jgi:DNA-binding SARP family transcriptional activator/transcriptional regulator with XRE-family HTH domain